MPVTLNSIRGGSCRWRAKERNRSPQLAGSLANLASAATFANGNDSWGLVRLGIDCFRHFRCGLREADSPLLTAC